MTASINWQKVKAAVVRVGVLGDADGVRPLMEWTQRVLHDSSADPDDLALAFEVIHAAATEFDRLEAGVTQTKPRPGAAMRYRKTHRFVYLNPDKVERPTRPWVEGPCMTEQEWEAAEERATAKRRESARKAVARMYADRPMSAAQALRVDEDTRTNLARDLGAKISGSIARGLVCPSCSRRSLWFALPKGWARCDHKESCGFEGPLDIVAGAAGVGARNG